MKTHILSQLAVICLSVGMATDALAQTSTYKLTAQSDPEDVCSLYRYPSEGEEGTSAYVSAYPKGGWNFQGWYLNDTLVSTESYYSFNMPARDLNFVARLTFNPENPADPGESNTYYPLTLLAEPDDALWLNSTQLVLAGRSMNLGAYFNSDRWQFLGWYIGDSLVCTDPQYTFCMPAHPLQLTQRYVFHPSSPANPGANYFNPETGEVILDDFKPGSLNSAFENLVPADSRNLVNQITVIGEMANYDMVSYMNYPSLSVLDFSRTYGVKQLSSYTFINCSQLTSVAFPASVEQIYSHVFYGCTSLRNVICHAVTPPDAPYAFEDIAQGAVLYVPAGSIQQYSEAPGWKDFSNIMAIQDQVCQMEVLLPAGVGEGLYLELVNKASAQRQRYLLSPGRQSYIFYGLLQQSTYHLYVKTRSGAILASQEDIGIGTDDVSVTLPSLLPVCPAELMVVTPEGTDVTGQTLITWTSAAAGYLGQGAVLMGNVEGDTLLAQVTLPQSLAMDYQLPASYEYVVSAAHPERVLFLDRYPTVALTGQVTDVTDGHSLSGVNVIASQTFAGKYSQSQSVVTDADGRFCLSSLAGVPTEVVLSASGYINRAYSYAEGMGHDISLADASLRPITGAVVALDVTFRRSVAAGEESEPVALVDGSNLSYTIYNVTRQRQVTDFSAQYPNLVLLEEVGEDDVLRVTLSSRTDLFEPVVTTGIVDAYNRIPVACSVVQRGAIRASYEQAGSDQVVGCLYDAHGSLVSRAGYMLHSVQFDGLAAGIYTLISMSESPYFNGVLNLNQLGRSGLVEGSDYTMNTLLVADGHIATIDNEEIPALDESRFYYTGDDTRFTSNKAEVVAGNYVTLTGVVDFKPEYADRVSNVSLVIDLPAGSSYVTNSLMIGNQPASTYTVDGQTITIPMADVSERVRLCVVSTQPGTCRPSASVRFTMDGKSLQQPIGSAQYQVSSLSLSVAGRTSTQMVSVAGVAVPESHVDLYDGQTLIGSTQCLKSGHWNITATLNHPYDYTYHQLHAHVISPEGLEFDTESRTVRKDSKSFCVTQILAYVNSQRLSAIPDVQPNGVQRYSYNPANPMFTFEAVTNTPHSNSLVSALYFNVTLTDGSAQIVPASYSASAGAWVASRSFSTDALPVSASAFYHQKPSPIVFDADYINLCAEAFANIDMHVVEVASQQEASPFLIQVDTLVNEPDQIVRLWTCYSRQGEQSFSIRQRATTTDVTAADLAAAQQEGFLVEVSGNPYYLVPVDDDEQYGIRVYDVTSRTCSEVMFYDYTAIEGLDGVMRKPTYQQSGWGYAAAAVGTVAGVAGLLVSASTAPAWAIGIGVVGLGAAIVGTVDYFNDTSNLKQKISDNKACLESKGKYDQIVHDYNVATGGGATSNVMGTASAKNGVLVAAAAPTAARFASSLGVLGLVFTGTGVLSSLAMDNVDAAIDDACNPVPVPGPEQPRWEPVIDPSGYVYEAVSSNRLQGVTATAYYKETREDMYGDLYEEVVLWDAEEYAQENPLFTDENGMYAWDVPTGLWQVKFEKNGYETTCSEWLPVPPPQLEVNVPMTQYIPAEVVDVQAYETGIIITFDKYMKPDKLTTGYISVVQGEQLIAGSIQLLDEEVAYAEGDPTYARQLRFIPASAFEAGSEIQLSVGRKVQTYAGIPMSDDFVQTFTVQRELSAIHADPVITLANDSLCTVTLQLLPASAAAGHRIAISSSTEEIASVSADTVRVDDQGYATFTLYGQLPGTATLTYHAVGTQVYAQSQVDVIQTLPTALQEVINEWTEGEGYIAIYSLSGTLLQRCDDIQSARCLTLADLEPGLYILSSVAGDHVSSRRVLKR